MSERAKSRKSKKINKQQRKRVKNGPQQIVKMRTQTDINTRYVAAGMSVLALVFALYCVNVKEYVGFIILGILAIVLIAIAVGYSSVEVDIKKLSVRITKVVRMEVPPLQHYCTWESSRILQSTSMQAFYSTLQGDAPG